MRSIHRYGIGLAIAALSGLAGLLVAPDLPQQMAVHWNAAGEADGYLPRWQALALLPGLSVTLLAGFALIPGIDPLGGNFRQFRVAYDWLAVLTVALLAYVHGITIALNLGYDIAITQAIAPAVAVLYIVLGFVLERAEQNWFVGIRTPWTLSDEIVWEKTHDRAAPLFKVAGVVALAALVAPRYAMVLLVVPVAVVALVATVYSYLTYRKVASGNAA